jgi:hypothetical protein
MLKSLNSCRNFAPNTLLSTLNVTSTKYSTNMIITIKLFTWCAITYWFIVSNDTVTSIGAVVIT